MTWKADCVRVLTAGDTASDLSGWVTIDNKSGATYANAALKLVAGDVNRAEDPRRRLKALEAAAGAPRADARHEFKEEGFFEYHLYTLDGRTTLKDHQTKQLALLTAGGVAGGTGPTSYGAEAYRPAGHRR